MSLVQMNWRPSSKELRDFGQAALVFLTIIGLLLHWLKGLDARWALYLCGLGLLLYGGSRIWAPMIKPVYLVLMLLAFPIGWAVGHVLMAFFYYFVLTPVGLLFRLIGRDLLHRKFDRTAATYWVRHRRPDSVKRYFNQF